MTLTNYWWLLIWVFVGGGALMIFVPKQRELVNGKKVERWTVPAALILILPYILWAGFRPDSFGDIIDILTKNPNVRIVKVNCTLYAYFQRSGSLVSGISVDLVRHLADYTMQKLVSLEDKNLKGIFAEDVIKRMLYVRYYYLLKKERIAAAECNEVIRSMLTLLSHRKVKYVVLYLIPELYRQFRLRNDPSMKIFEKNVKSSDYQCL